MRRLAAITCAVAVTATVAAPLPAAGDVGSSPTAKFYARAETACKKANKRVERLPKITDDNIGHVLATEAGIIASLTKRLKAIEPPNAKKEKVFRSMIAQLRLQTAHLRSAIKAAKKNRKKKVTAHLNGAVAAGKLSIARANELDLTPCARDYTPGVG